MHSLRSHQVLIFDADDTLWECNKYFEQAIHRFIDFLHSEHLSRDAIRDVLDTFERKNGYGAVAFAKSLVETWRELAPENDSGDEAMIERLGLSILDAHLEPIDGVAETLEALTPYHRLFLFTKGDQQEQALKISRSPLADRFEAHIITPDKTPQTYRDILNDYRMEPSEVWMIGNSLRSDILPALEAGINTIYIPNPHTWHMEHTDIERDVSWPGERLDLATFVDLMTVFRSTGNEIGH